jgi:hypothetical protein
MARIYLSSTFSDLEAHREAAYDALRSLQHDVVAMEDYVAADVRPLGRCLDDVESCDVYVGLFAWRYGFTPDDQPERDDGRKLAITHLEYEHARVLGKICLIFLAKGNAPWPPDQMDDDLSSIRDLRAQLEKEVLRGEFSNLDDLRAGVTASVARALDKPTRPVTGEDLANARFIRWTFQTWIGQLSGREQLVILLAGFVMRDYVVGAGSLLVGTFGVYPFNRMADTRSRHDLIAGYALALERQAPTPDLLDEIRRQAAELMGKPA